MAKKRSRPPGILDILLSVLVDPRGMMSILLVDAPYPPYLLTSLFFLGCVVIAPPTLYTADGNVGTPQILLLTATALTALLTATLAAFFQTMATRAIGSRLSTFSLFCAIIYSCVPFVTLMAFFYVATYWTQGHISVLHFLTTGHISQRDPLVQVFPTMVKITCFVSYLIFTNAIQVLMRISLSSAALVAAICVPLLMGSFVVALSLEELILPGISAKVIGVFAAFLGFHFGSVL